MLQKFCVYQICIDVFVQNLSNHTTVYAFYFSYDTIFAATFIMEHHINHKNIILWTSLDGICHSKNKVFSKVQI